MKKLFYLLLLPLLCVSCEELEEPEPDPADAFVGRYEYFTTMFATYGSASQTGMLEGEFSIVKLSRDRVRMTGDWSSIGEVYGNTVSFSDDYQSDASGYLTFKFGAASFSGGLLYFNYTASGRLKYTDGVAYPFTCNGSVTAHRID
ncbi:MAG: hypothetical protein IJ154_08445 [Bacteroidales bacterium]|nr:hypothetical protein [Bacteroidales bacterium]